MLITINKNTATAKLPHKMAGDMVDAHEGTEKRALISDDLKTGDITHAIISHTKELGYVDIPIIDWQGILC